MEEKKPRTAETKKNGLPVIFVVLVVVLLAAFLVAAWVIIGGLYGTPSQVLSAGNEMTEELPPESSEPVQPPVSESPAETEAPYEEIPTAEQIPSEVRLSSHFFMSKLKDEDLERLQELLSWQSVIREEPDTIVIETGGTDVKEDIEALLYKRLPELCSQPEYMHMESITTDDSCQETRIVVTGVDMTMEERQLIRDILISSLVYSQLMGYPAETVRVLSVSQLGNPVNSWNILDWL